MSKLTWQIGELLALASLGGQAQKANVEEYAGSEVKIAFGEHPKQYDLVFPPSGTAQSQASVIFFLHGGGWSMGEPEQYRFVGRFFASHGYPTILGGYRLVPEFVYPTQLKDASAGLSEGMAFFNKNAIKFRQIVLSGHSAGANLASLLTYNKEYTGREHPLVKGLFSLSGVLDFAACQNKGMQKLLAPYIGHLPNQEIANPIHYADPDLPISALCMHGDKDPLCPVQNSTSFSAKLNHGSSQKANCFIIPHQFHSDTITLFLNDSPERKILLDWLENLDKKEIENDNSQ